MMKNRHIFALLLSIAIMLPVFPAAVWADEITEVYTEFTGGNDNHGGNGTKESPYNLFEDALAAVADGGTIYIRGKKAFINDISNGQPLEITKNVTIECAPDSTYRPTLEMRKGGIVLGADVTFSNIVLSFPNAIHAAIFANGYTLKLDNISYSQNARVIQLAGGSLYDTDGSSLSPASGEHSRIIISGSDTQFGNIYAGSINGGFDKSVDIEIREVPGSAVGNIYSSGAKEGYYNSENFLDPDNEPEAPVADALLYPIQGVVSIQLTDSGIYSVDGKTGGVGNALLAVSAEYPYACYLDNIGKLTVEKGTFAPKTINDDVNVYIQSGGTLDMSSIPQCTVNDFYSENGILLLNINGCLTISGSCTGNAEFRTQGSRGTSGIAAYDHLYISTAGEGVFNFTPYPTQSDMTIYKSDDGWRTSVQTENDDNVVLKSFDITTPAIIASKSQVNGKDDKGIPVIPIAAEFVNDTVFTDIGMIPLEYTVRYNGEDIFAASTALGDGYYEGNIEQIHINFAPIEDSIAVSNVSDAYGNLGEIAEGVYDITITAPTADGYVDCFVRLMVIGDGQQTKDEMFTVSGAETEHVSVIFKNMSEADINGAVMLAAAYDNGDVLQKLVTAEQKVDAEQGKMQNFDFDMSDISYSKIKLFVWNSLEQMSPVCENYNSCE